jgi:hypothetical protein
MLLIVLFLVFDSCFTYALTCILHSPGHLVCAQSTKLAPTDESLLEKELSRQPSTLYDLVQITLIRMTAACSC